MSSSDEGIDHLESEEEVVAPKPKRQRKPKKKKDPNAPKRNQSAFFLYSNANRNRVKAENPDAKFGDIAKLISVEFKALSDHERAKWDKLAAEDKERYQREMEDYEPPSDLEDDAPKKRKAKKDPNAPKRNQSAFFLYSNATRNDVKEANPEAKFGDIAKIISTHFKALPVEERAYWDNKAAEDKARYQQQLQMYKETGHF